MFSGDVGLENKPTSKTTQCQNSATNSVDSILESIQVNSYGGHIGKVSAKIIGIGGGSASGKTTIAVQLVEKLQSRGITARCISMDNFYRSLVCDETGDTYDWDSIDAFDRKRLINCIIMWRNGQSTWIPDHDFSSYTSVEKSEFVQPCQVMVIEGIHALSMNELYPLFDIRIYVDCDHDEALARRITRDIKERNYTLEIVLKRYFTYVKPALINVIAPSKKRAHFIIPNNNGSVGDNKSIDLIANAL